MSLSDSHEAFPCLKILVIGPFPPPYHGVSIFTQMLLKSKMKEMYNVFHLDTSDVRDSVGMEKLDYVNLKLGIRNVIKLAFIICKRRPHIVYLPISQNRLAYLRDALFIFVSRLFSRKIIVHLHGSFFRLFYENSGWFMRSIIAVSLYYLDCAIVLGNSLRSLFKGLVPDHKVEVVPNGIDDIVSDHRWAENKKKDTEIQVTYLSTLRKNKGIFDFIQAIPYILAVYPDVQFKVAGTWFLSKEAIEMESLLSSNPEIRKKVDFLGLVTGNAKTDLLLNTSIFVFTPNTPEGQPLVLLEALAAGLPIITTNQGCISETVIDGENGLIVEAQNPRAIAEAIVYLIRNPDVRSHMRRANRERYKSFYTQDRCVERLMAVFEKTLKQSDQKCKPGSTIFTVVISVFFCYSDASAYIDPATGNFVFSNLAALLSALAAFLAILFRPLLRFCKWIFARFQRNQK